MEDLAVVPTRVLLAVTSRTAVALLADKAPLEAAVDMLPLVSVVVEAVLRLRIV